MDEKAIRIRLEGALETLEGTTARLDDAAKLLRGDWRRQVGDGRALFEWVRAQDAEAEATFTRVHALAEKERWPEQSEAARTLGRYRLAHAQLRQCARDALLPKTDLDFDALLATVIGESLPAPGGVLMKAKINRDPGPMVISVATLLMMAMLVPVVSTFVGGVCVGVGTLCGLLVALPWVFDGGWVMLFGDRVRKQGLIGGSELPLKPNMLSAHFLSPPRAPVQSQLLVPGWSALPVDQHPAEDLAALSSLLQRPPFDAPYLSAADGIVLRASRLKADHHPHGALWLGPIGALFIADGSESYDAATQVPGRGPNARARALGVALSAISSQRSAPIVERLIAAGRAEWVDPRTLDAARVEVERMVAGQLVVRFEKEDRAKLVAWLKRPRGQAT
jgi:hypothetical protein